MRFLLYFHTLLTVVGATLACFLVGESAGVSFLMGALVSLINLAGLVFAWPLILAKKLVALSIGVIVFKFAILGWILYEVVHTSYVHTGWFAGGLAIVVISVTATSFNISPKTASEAAV
jgi:hypothetical protein